MEQKKAVVNQRQEPSTIIPITAPSDLKQDKTRGPQMTYKGKRCAVRVS
jgi:hypothetical protein